MRYSISFAGIAATLLAVACHGGPQDAARAPDPSFRAPAELEAILNRSHGTHDATPDSPPIASTANGGAYADIVGEDIHEDLVALTEFALQSRRAGDPIWGRVQGSTHERNAADWIAGRLRELGEPGLRDIAHERVPLPPNWTLREFALEVVAGGAPNAAPALSSATPGWGSPSTPEQGVVAPLVYVGLGTEADLRGREIEGKIVLVHGRALGGVHMTTGESALSRIVRRGGAKGVIVMVDQPGNGRTLTRNGRDGPKIPNMTVGFLDGTYLRKAIEHSPPQSPPLVRMQIRAEWVEGLSTSAVSGVLPGATDEFVLFQAHLDGFWQAATDNGGGVAAVLALARHYAALPREARRRGMIFLFTGGHEDGSVGALHFGRQHAERMQRTALVIELEHVASEHVGPSMGGHYERTTADAPIGLFVTNQSPVVLDAYRTAAHRFGIPIRRRHYPNYWGDIIGLMPTGVPASGWIGSNFYYHSSLDTPGNVSPRALERIVRATAFVADAVNQRSRAELEAGAVTFSIPAPDADARSIHLGEGMPEELRRLFGFGSTLW